MCSALCQFFLKKRTRYDCDAKASIKSLHLIVYHHMYRVIIIICRSIATYANVICIMYIIPMLKITFYYILILNMYMSCVDF